SVWSLSLFLMGLWALQKDREETQTYWLAAVCLLTLAALIRKPYVLYLGCLFVFAHSRQKKLILFGGLGVFCLWQLYDRWLMDQYGSIFLRNLTYPHSAQEAGQLWGAIWKKWRGNWFSIYHMLWLVAGLMVWRLFPDTEAGSARQPWGRFFLLCLLAACGYFGVMMRQFADHDYYVIDSFYPPVFIGVLIASRGFNAMNNPIFLELILLALALPFAKNKLNWYQRSSGFEISGKTEKAYQNAEPLFQQLGIGKDAKILVFEAYSTNAPLNGMKRKGICLLTSKPSDQEKGFAIQPDYAVCLDTNFVSEVVNDNPEVVSKLAFTGRNDRFWVFKTGNYPGNTLANLLSTKEKILYDTTARSAEEFILSSILPPEPGKKVLVSGYISSDKPGKVMPTLALFREGGDMLAYLDKAIETGPDKTLRFVDFNIPNVKVDEMRIYLWNPDRLEVEVQEFKISLLDLKPGSEAPKN
ncbi:MAG: hypothetical protein JNJ57_05395, partial [Saprospiraceae bacterium]|nr:hypothetical protein [Saprospiraceae bacterium]